MTLQDDSGYKFCRERQSFVAESDASNDGSSSPSSSNSQLNLSHMETVHGSRDGDPQQELPQNLVDKIFR